MPYVAYIYQLLTKDTVHACSYYFQVTQHVSSLHHSVTNPSSRMGQFQPQWALEHCNNRWGVVLYVSQCHACQCLYISTHSGRPGFGPRRNTKGSDKGTDHANLGQNNISASVYSPTPHPSTHTHGSFHWNVTCCMHGHAGIDIVYSTT